MTTKFISAIAALALPSFAEVTSSFELGQIGGDTSISASGTFQSGAWSTTLDANLRRSSDFQNSLAALHIGRNFGKWRAGAVGGMYFGNTESSFFGLEAGRDFGALSADIRMIYLFKEAGVNTHTIDVSLDYAISDTQKIDFDWAHHSLVDNLFLFDEYQLTFVQDISPNYSIFAGGQLINAKKDTQYFDDIETAFVFGMRMNFGGNANPMRALPSHVAIGERADFNN